MMIKFFIGLFIGFFSLLSYSQTDAAPSSSLKVPKNVVYLVYFTGIGCSHCAKVDTVLLQDTVRSKNIMVLEYEIYKQRKNIALLDDYSDYYNANLGVPLIIAGDQTDQTITGDFFILYSLNHFLEQNKGNTITLPNFKVDFINLDLPKLPKLPKIWYKSRVAIKENPHSKENDAIKAFIINKTIPKNAQPVKHKQVLLSGNKIKFRRAVAFNGWLLMYD